MRRYVQLAGALTLSLGAMALATFAQGPPPPPQGPPPPPPPPPPPGSAVPFPNLTSSQLNLWNAGKAAFLAPATVQGGLGPVFNQAACAQCHGGAQEVGGSSTILTTRFGRVVNNQFDPMVAFGGPTLQTQGIGRFNGVNFVGEVVPPQATIVVHRRTIPLFGLGLVDALPDSAIIALAEHQASVSPLTAGVPSVATDPLTGETLTGKFGWKAQQPTLFAFAADALLNEVGVTTPVYSSENCPQGNCNLLAADPAQFSPNQPNGLIQSLANFMTFNAPPTPPPSGPPNPTIQAGQAIFTNIGCASCHQPTWTTGPNSVAALNNVTFAPYSDFLLHDMGSLGDGFPQGSAGPTQMRTAPLWGLRFETTFLHDGRASTVSQAILDHAGQGAAASHNFSTLTASQQSQLLAFLNSL
jgi:CxxC motif-containing protein (DUF1111 family)